MVRPGSIIDRVDNQAWRWTVKTSEVSNGRLTRAVILRYTCRILLSNRDAHAN
jgi:hypothetical protein